MKISEEALLELHQRLAMKLVTTGLVPAEQLQLDTVRLDLERIRNEQRAKVLELAVLDICKQPALAKKHHENKVGSTKKSK